MNRFLAAIVVASSIGGSVAASAQTRIETPIRSGTPVVLRTAEALGADGAPVKVGRVFSLELAQPIRTDGSVSIPAGTSATATVVSIKAPEAGRPGRIVARLQDLRFADRRIRLAGGLEGSGMGLAAIPAGLTVRGYVDEDVNADRPVVISPPVMAAAKPTIVVPVGARPVLVIENGPKTGTPRSIDRPPVVVANGTVQGSPSLVVLAPTAAAGSNKPVVVKTRRLVKVAARDSGTVESGGVVTRYTY